MAEKKVLTKKEIEAKKEKRRILFQRIGAVLVVTVLVLVAFAALFEGMN